MGDGWVSRHTQNNNNNTYLRHIFYYAQKEFTLYRGETKKTFLLLFWDSFVHCSRRRRETTFVTGFKFIYIIVLSLYPINSYLCNLCFHSEFSWSLAFKFSMVLLQKKQDTCRHKFSEGARLFFFCIFLIIHFRSFKYNNRNTMRIFHNPLPELNGIFYFLVSLFT